jgi:hypothetical protein
MMPPVFLHYLQKGVPRLKITLEMRPFNVKAVRSMFSFQSTPIFVVQFLEGAGPIISQLPCTDSTWAPCAQSNVRYEGAEGAGRRDRPDVDRHRIGAP